jgi:hypothetical protein
MQNTWKGSKFIHTAFAFTTRHSPECNAIAVNDIDVSQNTLTPYSIGI